MNRGQKNGGNNGGEKLFKVALVGVQSGRFIYRAGYFLKFLYNSGDYRVGQRTFARAAIKQDFFHGGV